MTNKKQKNKVLIIGGKPVSLRGRSFKGRVIKKFPKRVVIEFERTIYIKKYERYSKRKTKLHARVPDSMSQDIGVGDYIEVRECRPISKIVHFVVVGKIGEDGEKKIGSEKNISKLKQDKGVSLRDNNEQSNSEQAQEKEKSKTGKSSQDSLSLSDTKKSKQSSLAKPAAEQNKIGGEK